MVKNYKQFNESLRDLMVGPTEDEVLDNLKKLTPNEMLIKSCKIDFLKAVEIALDRGANSYLSDGMVLLYMKQKFNLNDDEVFDLIKDLEPTKLLSMSIESGNIKGLELAFSKGVDFKYLGSEESCLTISLVCGYYNLVKWFLDRDNIKKIRYDWYIRMARKDKHYDIVELLKEYKDKFINSKKK